MRRLLRACTGGRCGHVARAAGVAQRSACVDGTAYAAGLGGTSGPGVGRRLLRACTGGRCGRVARASGAAQRPRDACGWAAWTGHASPVVRALQSRPIDDTNPRCSAAEVARFRSLRRPPPHRHRRGRHPAGSFPPAVALLHQKPLRSQHRNKATKPVCSSTCCVRLSAHWSSDLVTLSRIPPCGCRRARRSDTPGIGGGVFMATMVGGGASS